MLILNEEKYAKSIYDGKNEEEKSILSKVILWILLIETAIISDNMAIFISLAISNSHIHSEKK